MNNQLKVERVARKSVQATEGVFDPKVLEHHTMGDQRLATEIMRLFLSQLARLENHDWQDFDLNFEMHTLCGSAAVVGATRLQDLSKSWQKLGIDLEPRIKAAIVEFRVAALA